MKSYLKRISDRGLLWLVGFLILLFFDEFIKEGYFFKVSDIYNLNITHEKIILFVVALIFIWLYKFRKRFI